MDLQQYLLQYLDFSSIWNFFFLQIYRLGHRYYYIYIYIIVWIGFDIYTLPV